MKKILAVALAVVMMFSVSVLAFAANPITQDTDQTETIDVYTVVDAADDTYTLTFALTGTTDAQSFSGYVTSQTVDLDATVSSFEGVAVGEYTGTMTYTVTYAAA